ASIQTKTVKIVYHRIWGALHARQEFSGIITPKRKIFRSFARSMTLIGRNKKILAEIKIKKRGRKMKSGISILSFVAGLMVFSLSLFSQIAISGRGASDQVKNQSLIVDAAEPRDEYHKIEGSWNHVTTRLNCTTGAVLGTFQAMFTFSQGGTFWEASSNV